MPKTKSAARPYNRSEKKIAKGMKSALENTKAKGADRVVGGRASQSYRNIGQHTDKVISDIVKEKGTSSAHKPGGSLTRGTTFSKGKDGSVKRSAGDRAVKSEQRKPKYTSRKGKK